MYDIVIQRATRSKSLPTSAQLTHWAEGALQNQIPHAEVTIRIVDKDEIQSLNATYRHKDKPTNVLSFPFDMPSELSDETPILGDIIICADVIKEESAAQHKTEEAHWAHMVVHGILHLLGYDHENNQDADIMEAKEISILQSLGFTNPYIEKGHHE